MTCDRYWREGIVLVERGMDDPHRAECADCVTAHASRQELIEALPLVGAGHTGDPRWQAQVWRRIDGESGSVLARWRWQLAGVLAVACAVALWVGRAGTRDADGRPTFETIRDGVAMRSGSVVAGARLRVRVDATSEVWLYYGDRLMHRCRAQQDFDGCVREPGGMMVEVVLATAGRYVAFAVEGPVAPPLDALDEGRAALDSAGARYVEQKLVVR
jgi:hypothetical protein